MLRRIGAGHAGSVWSRYLVTREKQVGLSVPNDGSWTLQAPGWQMLPEDVIAATAEKVGADMVILGISPRQGLAAAFASHTTEKVMEKIEVDVVALN